MAEVQVQSLRAKHHFIIDHLIADPTIKGAQLAAMIGCTSTWLSIVMNSDVFKEEYAKRRRDHAEGLSHRIGQKQLEVHLKSLEKLELALDDDDVEDRLILDACDRTAKMLGFSPSPGTAPQFEATERTREVTREVGPGVVERARETIRQIRSSGMSHALPSTEG